MFKRGDSLHIWTGMDEDGQMEAHLHFVLLDPEPKGGMTIIVNIESINPKKKKQDLTTVLGPGDHKCVTRESCVPYRRALLITATRLREIVEQKLGWRDDPLAPDVLERVRSGLLKSRHTPPEVCDFYEDHLFDGI